MRVCTVSIIRNGFRYAHTTAGRSLFEAAAKALDWWEFDLPADTAFRPCDDEILKIALVGGETYCVRVGRVREWMRTS